MRSSLFLLMLLLSTLCLSSQTKIPFIFRQQEKKLLKHIRKYLQHDTVIETAKAKIHIHYSIGKDKPILILFHGMGVDAKTNWFRQVKRLSKHFNLLIPDMIYFGESTAKENNYSVEFQAEQFHELLKLLNIHSKVNVMGFSYGGLAAAVYNQLYANEVNKLIIIDGPVKFFSSKMADSLALVAGVQSMTNIIVPQNVKDYKAMEKAVMSKKIPTTRNFKLKLMKHYFIPTLASRKLQLDYLTDNQVVYQNYNYNIDKTPTLLIWGAKDGVVPLSVGQQLHEHFLNTTRLIVYKRSKHDVHFRYAKKMNKEIVNFLTN